MWLKVLGFVCAGVFVGAAIVELGHVGDGEEPEPEDAPADAELATEGDSSGDV